MVNIPDYILIIFAISPALWQFLEKLKLGEFGKTFGSTIYDILEDKNQSEKNLAFKTLAILQERFGIPADLANMPGPEMNDHQYDESLQILLSTKYEEVLNKYNEILELLQHSAKGQSQLLADVNRIESTVLDQIQKITKRINRLEHYNLNKSQIEEFKELSQNDEQ